MHRESLLHIPLVRHLLADPQVRLEARRVDNHWKYQGLSPLSVTGFNHFLGRVFYAESSAMARWLKVPEQSARLLNEGDFLVPEVLFAVHDYLHVWSLFAINKLRPELGMGVAPITRDNVEDFAFCHLVTEAAATVGVDYWYLSTVDLDKEVPIGTNRHGLTANYHERHGEEYRRFNPSFKVQQRDFFDRLARFYCDGVFQGFDVNDLKQSPRILSWLRHELSYGVDQRRYIRQWLSYLSGGAVRYTAEELAAPVDVGAEWKQRLVGDIGERLWDKVKLDRQVSEGLPIAEAKVWRRARDQRPDFRFTNANAVPLAAVRDLMTWENAGVNFDYFFFQYLSSFEHAAFDPSLRQIVPLLRDRKDPGLVQRLFQSQKTLPERAEFADMMILN